ncbi:MAG: hypothetical protein KME60_10970 [Cyanomargarita calcarea GSE-NOS-MK-12-04C]|uniref:Uncharacterized protein n=1 Tax=Cyanomargarita calcarea GSE-NOS-MK-12-04C TaxID=2839659 RepID=A0A951QL32_9CYAN|nr:hypothetical protein [Cyanomargarita calcarea GSE-NOS-MK-12-04C]
MKSSNPSPVTMLGATLSPDGRCSRSVYILSVGDEASHYQIKTVDDRVVTPGVCSFMIKNR